MRLALIGKIKFTLFLGPIQQKVNLKSNLNYSEVGVGHEVERSGEVTTGKRLILLREQSPGTLSET